MGVRIVQPTSAVGHLVAQEALRVDPMGTMADVAVAMRRFNVSSALVGHDGAIVTERDLARGLAMGLGPDACVNDVASPQAVRVPSDMSVVDAAAIMLNQEVRHLVVDFDDGRVGVISLRDLMAVLLQASSPHLWLTPLRLAVGAPAEVWLG